MSDALCTRLQQQVVLSGTALWFSSESLDLDCVIVEILSWLPAKSLLRFRCVCKAWRALISDPYFIRKHLSHINTKISTSYSHLLREQIFRSVEYEAILEYLSLEGSSSEQKASFSECQVLPQPPVRASRECFFGFGYDSTTDDYKVILGSYKPGYGFVENVEYVVAVFMLKRGSWRKLERLNRYFGVSCEGCLVNEALHWVLDEKEDGWFIDLKIVSFDLAEEKFHLIPFPYPPNPNDRQGFIAQVGVLNKFMTTGDRGGWNFQMWVLKDYGVKGSWTEVTSIPSEVVDDEYTCMACISDNGEILMQLEDAAPLALYNPKEKTYKTLMGYGGYWYETATYIETLVSPLTGSTGAVMCEQPNVSPSSHSFCMRC